MGFDTAIKCFLFLPFVSI